MSRVTTFRGVAQVELGAGLLQVPGAPVVGALQGAVEGLGGLAGGEEERQGTVVALKQKKMGVMMTSRLFSLPLPLATRLLILIPTIKQPKYYIYV